MGYTSEWRVRFGDVDRAGVIYYPRAFEAVQHATEDLMRDAGFSFHRLIDQEGWSMPIVNAETTYQAPIEYGDIVEIELVPELTERSVIYHATGRVDGEAAFETTVTMVAVDMEAFEPRPLPDEVRAALERFAD
jgi:4-hydroxybenzoyl-CoA thioesterase